MRKLRPSLSASAGSLAAISLGAAMSGSPGCTSTQIQTVEEDVTVRVYAPSECVEEDKDQTTLLAEDTEDPTGFGRAVATVNICRQLLNNSHGRIVRDKDFKGREYGEELDFQPTESGRLMATMGDDSLALLPGEYYGQLAPKNHPVGLFVIEDGKIVVVETGEDESGQIKDIVLSLDEAGDPVNETGGDTDGDSDSDGESEGESEDDTASTTTGESTGEGTMGDATDSDGETEGDTETTGGQIGCDAIIDQLETDFLNGVCFAANEAAIYNGPLPDDSIARADRFWRLEDDQGGCTIEFDAGECDLDFTIEHNVPAPHPYLFIPAELDEAHGVFGSMADHQVEFNPVRLRTYLGGEQIRNDTFNAVVANHPDGAMSEEVQEGYVKQVEESRVSHLTTFTQ